MSTKARMVDSAVTLLREQGVPGVTIDAVLAHSSAPRGSVYHHFPGGRSELILTAGHTASDFITSLLRKSVEANDPQLALDRFVAFWHASLEASDYRAGCPIVALTVGNRDLAEADDLVRETFAIWHQHLTGLLAANGRSRADAEAEATLMVAAIEGAVVLCKAQRSAVPLEQVAGVLSRVFAPAQKVAQNTAQKQEKK